jgi:hypothetical protein
VGGTGSDSTVQSDRQAGRILGIPVLTVALTYAAVSASRPFLTSTLQAADGARKAIDCAQTIGIRRVECTTTSDFPEERLSGPESDCFVGGPLLDVAFHPVRRFDGRPRRRRDIRLDSMGYRKQEQPIPDFILSAIALEIYRIRVISMRYSSTPFRFFDLVFTILSSHTPSAASLTTRSSILESVFECLFRRSLSQLSQTDPT